MKIYNKIVFDKDDNIIEEDSYEYSGPIAHCGGGNPIKKIIKPIAKVFKSIVRGVGKVFSGLVSAVTSPFGFDIDTPDFGIGTDQVSDIQGVMLNKQSAIEHIPVVYGTRMVGGTRIFVSTNGSNNKYLFVDMVLAEGQCNGFTKLLVDDTEVPLTSYAHGVVAEPSSGDFQNRMKVQFFDGRDDQVSASDGSGVFADIDSSNGAPGWTNLHRLSGLCHIACRFEWKEIKSQDDANNNPYTGGIPNIKLVLQGKKILDATTLTGSHSTLYDNETVVFNNNPVSVLLDYMRSNRYGKGLANDAFDFASFKTAADLCDQTVTYTSATTGKAFTSDAVVNTANSILANCKILLMGFRGIMPYQQGKYKLQIEHGGDNTDITATPTNPSTVFSVTNDHIVGGMSLEGEHKNAKINRCIVTFVDPGTDDNVSYQPNQVVYPEEGSAIDVAMLAEDDGKRLQKEIVLPTVTSREQALQYGEVFTKRSRTSKYVQFGTTLATSNTGVGDLINIENEHIGLNGVFRIVEMKIDAGGDIIIGAVEHQPTNYEIAAKSIAATRPIINLPNPIGFVNPPTGIVYTSRGINFTPGFPILAVVRPIGEIRFSPSVDSNITHYRFGVKMTGSTEAEVNYFDKSVSTLTFDGTNNQFVYQLMGSDVKTKGGIDAEGTIRIYAINNQGNQSAPAELLVAKIATIKRNVVTQQVNQQSTNVNLNP